MINERVQGGIADTLTVSIPLRTKYTQSTYEVHPKYDTVIQTITRKNSEKGVLLYFFLKIIFIHNKDGKRQTAATDNLSTIIL